MGRSRHCIQLATGFPSCPTPGTGRRENRGPGQLHPSMTPSSWGQSILMPGPPTEEQATPTSPSHPARLLQHPHMVPPNIRFQALTLGPAHCLTPFLDRAEIRCSKQLLLRKVACSTGQSSRPHHWDGICGGPRSAPPSLLPASTSGQPKTFLPCTRASLSICQGFPPPVPPPRRPYT